MLHPPLSDVARAKLGLQSVRWLFIPSWQQCLAVYSYCKEAGTKVAGGWKIKSIRGPNTYEIGDGTASRIVHIN